MVNAREYIQTARASSQFASCMSGFQLLAKKPSYGQSESVAIAEVGGSPGGVVTFANEEPQPARVCWYTPEDTGGTGSELVQCWHGESTPQNEGPGAETEDRKPEEAQPVCGAQACS